MPNALIFVNKYLWYLRKRLLSHRKPPPCRVPTSARRASLINTTIINICTETDPIGQNLLLQKYDLALVNDHLDINEQVSTVSEWFRVVLAVIKSVGGFSQHKKTDSDGSTSSRTTLDLA